MPLLHEGVQGAAGPEAELCGCGEEAFVVYFVALIVDVGGGGGTHFARDCWLVLIV